MPRCSSEPKNGQSRDEECAFDCIGSYDSFDNTPALECYTGEQVVRFTHTDSNADTERDAGEHAHAG